ncbi:HesB/YadR/YfhF family protein [Pontibacillus salicampi]|uniref:HesB/YadR/YfhF family protein n=1 Tax=Pontibacillus salicampi TaxID=1449801 RepID=A0ABV6LRE5_9BACI
MKLSVQEQAANWYKDELELEKDSSLRFFVRYGGVGGLKPGFSLGIRPEEPVEPVAEDTVKDVQFYIEQEDAWYFDHHDVTVYYNEDKQEPDFEYKDTTS